MGLVVLRDEDVVIEKDGWKLGPDSSKGIAVQALNDSERYWALVSPAGNGYGGSRQTLEKLLGDDSPADAAWRKNNS